MFTWLILYKLQAAPASLTSFLSSRIQRPVPGSVTLEFATHGWSMKQQGTLNKTPTASWRWNEETPTNVRPTNQNTTTCISFKQEQKEKGKRCSIPSYPCISSICTSTTITGPNCHMMSIRLRLVPNIHQHVQVTCELCKHTIPLHAYKMHTFFFSVKTGYQIGSDPRQQPGQLIASNQQYTHAKSKPNFSEPCS